MKNPVIFLVALILSACVSAPKTSEMAQVRPDVISVMTLNAENLFDIEDEPDKNDEAFLPKSMKSDPVIINRCYYQQDSDYRTTECLKKDWSAKILDRKMRRLADVVAQINNGHGPDILILQEVENRRVLEIWRDKYLRHMNYQTISHIEGPDTRGIDTAVMSRLPEIGQPKLHLLDYSKAPDLKPEDIRPTRGILETHLRMPNGSTVAVFSLHFPSQGAETIHRRVAVETLMDVTAQVPVGTSVIIGGDFNITTKEEWKHKYFKDILASRFTVSHIHGCKGCVGTSYYHQDRTWSFFDVLLFSHDLTAGLSPWRLDVDSIRLAKDSVYQVNRWGSPAKFKGGKGAVGVTDHYPVYAELKLNKSMTSETAQ